MEAFGCLDCKKETKTVLDHRTGDTICTECGLVLESYYVDETSEWRTFADNSDDKDPARVGGPTNPFLTHSSLTTIISNSTPCGNPLASSLNRLQNLEPNPEQSLMKGLQVISTMTDNLGLNSVIKARAHEIFAKVGLKRCSRGKTMTSYCAACVFTACRELKLSRTLKEISTVADGVSMKEINKGVLALKREVDIDMAAVNIGELVRRFCSNLRMNQQEIKAVQEAVQKAEEFDIRRNPKSVLAAIIYMVTQLSDNGKRPLRDISAAADVAEGTIKKSYKDIYPYALRLIPSWYSNQEAVKAICFP